MLRCSIREGSVFREHAAAAVGFSLRTARSQDDFASSWLLAVRSEKPETALGERLECTHVLDLNRFDNKVSLLLLWIEGNQHVSPIDQIGATLKLRLSFDAA